MSRIKFEPLFAAFLIVISTISYAQLNSGKGGQKANPSGKVEDLNKLLENHQIYFESETYTQIFTIKNVQFENCSGRFVEYTTFDPPSDRFIEVEKTLQFDFDKITSITFEQEKNNPLWRSTNALYKVRIRFKSESDVKINVKTINENGEGTQGLITIYGMENFIKQLYGMLLAELAACTKPVSK